MYLFNYRLARIFFSVILSIFVLFLSLDDLRWGQFWSFFYIPAGSKAFSDFGYSPEVDWRTAVGLTVEWYRNFFFSYFDNHILFSTLKHWTHAPKNKRYSYYK